MPQIVPAESRMIILGDRYASPQYYRSFDLQREVFTRILQKCAAAGGKILTVHSLRSAKAVLDLVETHLPPATGKVVLHWFTGTKSEARRALDLGCYFSINAAMLRNEKGRDLVAALPADRLLTETDAPFTKINNRPTSPIDVKDTVQILAGLRGVTEELQTAAINSNLRDLLHGE